MKLIIDIPKGTYKAVKVGTINQVLEYKVWNAIQNGTSLDSNSERAEIQAYFDGESFGWDEGRKALIDELKAEIEQNAYPIVHGVNNHEKGMTLYGILQVIDNIGKAESEEV